MKIALFGASPRPDSLALKIQNRIICWNQTFFPINPKYEEIDGIKTYPDLISLPEIPDLVVFMTNPHISLALLDQVAAKKVKKVWFQPGSFDDSVIAKAETLGLKINTTHCILVAPQNLVEEFVNKD
ncbi:CoA-binding protein [Candidatus Gracilibacteria bacterium]|nr:CoA-binding protein [Candidatus Gracilibacteria bacterium]